ncbi:glucose 1-dehydrogenase [Sphingomonas faeni]|jgi:glucose 1-dehydrogenase|uniref:glucose 1-dehydrogenase n=1 Tax=Sphingomonas faeni TaxID=185950 RepID=UPI0027839D19|nr:glucose 1-dehydrogenase [Sphingomonas faeni]MDQ0836990.1 glucose 1-dehydrogenase [Sphingomonas faeni]
MHIDLTGQAAIVTGASSGLGRASAIAFAKAGAKVAINYNSSADKAHEVVAEIEQAGGEAFACEADTSDEAAVLNLFDETVERFGGVDIVFANAGMQKDAAYADLTLEDWKRVIDVNLTGQFLVSREAVRRFRKQGDRGFSRAIGKILFMSSVHEVIPWAGHANYAASKGGSGMLMRTLAQEIAGDRIRVNGIAPGAIATEINEDATADQDKLLELIPYGRIGDPEDVARAALFLVSDAADYIVGSTLTIDGGMSLYPGFRDNG